MTVAIDPEAVARVARLTRRQLQPGGAFWREQAERLLSAYLWSEGKVPENGRLTVHDVSREDLEVATAWTGGLTGEPGADRLYFSGRSSRPMPDISVQVEIPNRALFKAAEVCDLVKVQPYVLRSWEAEFPALGVSKSGGRRRASTGAPTSSRCVRIKHLLLVDGLTLAGRAAASSKRKRRRSRPTSRPSTS